MADESDSLPASQVVRWAAGALVILLAAAVYLRDGRRLPPLRAAPEAVPAGDTLASPTC